MTRSGCVTRSPCLTVASKSVDRVMRFCAESTAMPPGMDQAVSERRPLRRRLDTIARPARVRIRSRKPWTRAWRRLFGWKVRLPFATALSSLPLASHPATYRVRPDTIARTKPQLALCLAGNRRGPRTKSLGSQPYRRLSGDCSRVLMRLRRVKPVAGRCLVTGRPLTGFTPATRRQTICLTHARNVAERLALARKTVSFGPCRFRPERRPTTKRGWRTGSLPRQPTVAVSGADLVRRRR